MNFDPYEFINSNYTNFTIDELNNELENLSKSISLNTRKNKEQISLHFSKFIECRNTLEDIYDKINSDKNEVLKIQKVKTNLSTVLGKYKVITDVLFFDLNQETLSGRKVFLENKFRPIFQLKQNLQDNMHNYENFVRIYKEAKDLYKRYSNSVILTECMDSVKTDINNFLEDIYLHITSSHLSFKESMYYFDMYFFVSEKKTDRKMMNTLLVGFKETTIFSKIDDIEKYYSFLENSLLRLIRNIDDDLRKDAIIHFFRCINTSITTCIYARLIYRKCTKQKYEIKKMSDAILSFYSNTLSDSKINKFREIIKDKIENYQEPEISSTVTKPSTPVNALNRRYDEISELYYKYTEFCSSIEVRRCQEIVFLQLKDEINLIELEEDYDYLNIDIQGIRRCLGSKNSHFNQELDRILIERKKFFLDSLSRKLNDYLENSIGKNKQSIQNITKVLIYLCKMIDQIPKTDFREILYNSRKSIQNYPVLLQYLADAAGLVKTKLNEEEEGIYNYLKKQFGFFLLI